jgi:hypothetical protein
MWLGSLWLLRCYLNNENMRLLNMVNLKMISMINEPLAGCDMERRFPNRHLHNAG